MLNVVFYVLCSKRRVKSDRNVRAKRWCIWWVQTNMLVHWELTLLCEDMSAGSLLTDVFIVVNKLRSKMACCLSSLSSTVTSFTTSLYMQWQPQPMEVRCKGQRWGSWRGGRKPTAYFLWGFSKCCRLLVGVQVRVPAAWSFSCILIAPGSFCWHLKSFLLVSDPSLPHRSG